MKKLGYPAPNLNYLQWEWDVKKQITKQKNREESQDENRYWKRSFSIRDES